MRQRHHLLRFFCRLPNRPGDRRDHVELEPLGALPLQALFTQLGFDTTATFTKMDCQFRVKDGTVQMTRMQVKSDLLSLVGYGEIRFDGRMRHDLEVRYSLIDKLGPLTRLLYKIQNSLLRISVRGDMSRPEVSVKGLFSQFFPTSKGGVQALPLPALSVLQKRF